MKRNLLLMAVMLLLCGCRTYDGGWFKYNPDAKPYIPPDEWEVGRSGRML